MNTRKFKNHETVIAHRDQICDYCMESIKTGKSYCLKYRVYDRSLDEGRHVHHKSVRVHIECENASLSFSQKDWMRVYSGTFQRPETKGIDE